MHHRFIKMELQWQKDTINVVHDNPGITPTVFCFPRTGQTAA